MTTEPAPFEVKSGESIVIPSGGVPVFYQGPTLPPSEVFANIQPIEVSDTPPKITVTFFTGDRFLFWSPSPAFDTLTLIETGKVYRVTTTVDTLWVVPSGANGGMNVGAAVAVAAVVGVALIALGRRKR